MTPDFSKIVDPIILSGLALLERIERNQHEPITVEYESIKKQIDRGDQQFGAMSTDWQLAKYALVAWLDEQLISFPWEGREWWTNHILERHYFSGRRRHLNFRGRKRLQPYLTGRVEGFIRSFCSGTADSIRTA
jgi:type VI secretion system protein ImpK